MIRLDKGVDEMGAAAAEENDADAVAVVYDCLLVVVVAL